MTNCSQSAGPKCANFSFFFKCNKGLLLKEGNFTKEIEPSFVCRMNTRPAATGRNYKKISQPTQSSVFSSPTPNEASTGLKGRGEIIAISSLDGKSERGAVVTVKKVCSPVNISWEYSDPFPRWDEELFDSVLTVDWVLVCILEKYSKIWYVLFVVNEAMKHYAPFKRQIIVGEGKSWNCSIFGNGVTNERSWRWWWW